MAAVEDVRHSGSSVLDVGAQLVAAIRDGQLAPGQRLVETEFARRFGVARTTIREAFQRLEVEGLLSQERHRGFTIRTLDRQELREAYEARAVLDGLAARLSAPHFKADSAELDRIHADLEAARLARDMKEFTLQNRAFHELIRQVSGNALVGRMLGRLEQSVYHYQFRLLVENAQVFTSQDDHVRIYEALKAGDGEAAEREARAHAMHSLDQLMELPDGMFGR
jgi:DNA-binding GntR family transcriptional regulator